MKNVLIYNIINSKERYPKDTLVRTLQAQIDNSLQLGWKVGDIVIGTNFEFEYMGVKAHQLNNVCEYNPFVNKWYGMLELMEKGILKEDFWFHDQDNWQLYPIEFPSFDGEIAGCTYVFTPEWNTASLFIKKSAIDILQYIKEFMDLNHELNLFSDENYIAILRAQTEISSYLTTINNEYNVGITKMEDRYNAANKPVKVIGVKPENKHDIEKLEGANLVQARLLTDEILTIFSKYSLL